MRSQVRVLLCAPFMKEPNFHKYYLHYKDQNDEKFVKAIALLNKLPAKQQKAILLYVKSCCKEANSNGYESGRSDYDPDHCRM